MSRSAKPRRAYRPRYTPGHMLLPGQRDKIAIPVHAALAAIELGGGETHHRHTIAAFLNIAATLSVKLKAAMATRDAVADGQTAMVSADKRFLSTGRWGLSGPEMIALRRAITLGDELLKRANSSILSGCIAWIYSINETSPAIFGTAENPLAA